MPRAPTAQGPTEFDQSMCWGRASQSDRLRKSGEGTGPPTSTSTAGNSTSSHRSSPAIARFSSGVRRSFWHGDVGPSARCGCQKFWCAVTRPTRGTEFPLPSSGRVWSAAHLAEWIADRLVSRCGLGPDMPDSAAHKIGLVLTGRPVRTGDRATIARRDLGARACATSRSPRNSTISPRSLGGGLDHGMRWGRRRSLPPSHRNLRRERQVGPVGNRSHRDYCMVRRYCTNFRKSKVPGCNWPATIWGGM